MTTNEGTSWAGLYSVFLSVLILVLIFAYSTTILGGCAGKKDDKNPFDDSIYKEVMERQKSGSPLPEDTPEKAPPLTATDHERLGDQYLGQGNISMAQLEYKKALESADASAAVKPKLGLTLLRQSAPEQALGLFQQILHDDPDSVDAQDGLGQAYFQLGRDREAEEAFRHVLAKDPRRWHVHNFMGLLRDRQQRYPEAIQAYEAAIALRPREASLHNNLGISYHLNGQYEAAIAAFGQALKIGPPQARIYNNLALAHAKLGQYRQAFEAFRKATDDAQAYNNLGMVYLTVGRTRQAVTCFETAIELHPRYYEKANQNLLQARQALAQAPSNSDQGSLGPAPCP